jgi:hypothetical protein
VTDLGATTSFQIDDSMLTCVSICPPQAIKVDQSNLEYHEKSAGTLNEELAKGSAPPPHAH